MSDFVLDARFAADCHLLGRLDNTLLLLMDNSLVPWMILVPMVQVTEWHELEWDSQLQILGQINLISQHLKNEYAIDKINLAAIGNIVRQLHIHIIGRSESDYCWPNVVWGAAGRRSYAEPEIENTVAAVKRDLGDRFTPA